jgi:hypothetical protein
MAPLALIPRHPNYLMIPPLTPRYPNLQSIDGKWTASLENIGDVIKMLHEVPQKEDVNADNKKFATKSSKYLWRVLYLSLQYLEETYFRVENTSVQMCYNQYRKEPEQPGKLRKVI